MTAVEETPLSSLLLRLVDAGIIAILFFAPLFMGGRHPVGRLILVSIVATMSIAWFLRQCVLKQAYWRATAGQWVFLAAIVLVVLQLVPLSSEWIATLTPSTQTLLPLWSDTGQSESYFSAWKHLSLNPQMTLYGLSILFAYGITFLITVQRVETLEDVQIFLKWIALAALAFAVIGLAQYVSSGDKFLWTYEHPFRKAEGIQGPFINPNHFCHLLALGVGPCLGWLILRLKKPSSDVPLFLKIRKQSSIHGYKTVLASLAAGIVIFACFLALSRGGMIATLVAITTAISIYCLRRLIDRRYIWGALAALAVGGVLFAIHGGDQIATELNTLSAGSFNEADYKGMRQSIWEANRKAIESRPWFGHGVGTHRELYKAYLEKPFPVEFSHAESGYLQVGSETGIAGLSILLCGITVIGFWCFAAFRNNQNTVEIICIGAITASLAASVVHSVVDFVWYIPACMSWTAILCGLACRLYQLRKPPARECPRSPTRIIWCCTTFVVAILSVCSVYILVPPARAAIHWDRFQVYAKERKRLELSRMNLGKRSAKEEQVFRLSAGLDMKMEEELLKYSAIDIDNPNVHLGIAANYLRQFQSKQRSSQNPMDVGQIRDAAIASQFSSREALDGWLARAIGEHRHLLYRALWHARQAAMRCPLQGEAYLFLGELVFLEGKDHSTKSQLIQQALRVRPYDGKVLLMAGKEAAIAGDVQAAVDYWRQSYKQSIDGKYDLIQLLSQRVPAELTIEILEPKAADIALFCRAYRRLADPQKMKFVCDHFHQLLLREREQTANMAVRWTKLSRAYLDINRVNDAVWCAEQGLKCDLNSFETHLLLGSIFVKTGAFSAAEQQLRWCVLRRPDHPSARQYLEDAVKGKIAKHQQKSNESLIRQ